MSRLMNMVGTIGGVPVGVPGLTVMMMVMMTSLVPRMWGWVYVRYYKLGAVFGSFPIMSSVTMLSACSFMQLFPCLTVVSVETTPRF